MTRLSNATTGALDKAASAMDAAGGAMAKDSSVAISDRLPDKVKVVFTWAWDDDDWNNQHKVKTLRLKCSSKKHGNPNKWNRALVIDNECHAELNM
jgi:hypothetical protein